MKKMIAVLISLAIAVNAQLEVPLDGMSVTVPTTVVTSNSTISIPVVITNMVNSVITVTNTTPSYNQSLDGLILKIDDVRVSSARGKIPMMIFTSWRWVTPTSPEVTVRRETTVLKYEQVTNLIAKTGSRISLKDVEDLFIKIAVEYIKTP